MREDVFPGGNLCEKTIKERWMEHLKEIKFLVNCHFWIQKGKMMLHEFIVLLFKGSQYCAGGRWMG